MDLPQSREISKSDRVLYLDALRIIAAFFVVVIHTSAYIMKDVPLQTSQWRVCNVYDSIAHCAVPLFAMVSGAVFLDPARDVSMIKLFRKYILRIISAFLFWSVFYVIFNAITESEYYNVKRAIVGLISGEFHMWYLYMIVGLYLVVPILRRITATEKMTEYFLLLSLVFTFAIPLFLFLGQMVDAHFSTDGKLTAFGQNIIDKVYFNLTLGYVPYFVGGYYLNKRDLSIPVKRIIYFLGLLGAVATIFLTSWLSLYNNEKTYTFYEHNQFGILFFSSALFILAKSLFNLKSEKVMNNSIYIYIYIYMRNIALVSI